MPGARLDPTSMARRAAQEIRAGEAVAIGSGLPAEVPSIVPSGSAVWFLSETGAAGYTAAGYNGSTAGNAVDDGGSPVSIVHGGAFVGVADIAAMLAGGHVGLAFVEAAQVSASGDFVHWTTAETPGLDAPGFAVDIASGVGRVVALMTHALDGGISRIIDRCSLPIDGARCISTIITDVAVLRITGEGLALAEVAPGWTSDDIISLTDAPLSVPSEVREMSLEVPDLLQPNKVYATAEEALHDVADGAIVNVDGFGGPGGMAHYLMTALRDKGTRGLTMISNTAGIARVARFGVPEGLTAIDHTILVENGQVAKAIASYPVSPSINRPTAFERAYQEGESDLEVSPQGTLAERLRSGGAGVGAFYTPTAVGTLLGDGKELREIDGRQYVLEQQIIADFCIIRGHKADTLGNMVYRGTSRNFNPVMATAARVTVVEVDEIVEPGELGPEEIVTPGIYVDRIVRRPPGFSPYLES